MNLDGIINIFTGITTVALVFVIVSNPGSANLIGAFGRAYAGGLRAAMGK